MTVQIPADFSVYLLQIYFLQKINRVIYLPVMGVFFSDWASETKLAAVTAFRAGTLLNIATGWGVGSLAIDTLRDCLGLKSNQKENTGRIRRMLRFLWRKDSIWCFTPGIIRLKVYISGETGATFP